MSLDSNYGFTGAIPPGITVEGNVIRAQNYQNTHTPIESFLWFHEVFRNNLDRHLPLSESMDFKQIDREYAPFGNFNYGVVGRAIGIPQWMLEYAAGYAQGRADGLSIAETFIDRSLTPQTKETIPKIKLRSKKGF